MRGCFELDHRFFRNLCRGEERQAKKGHEMAKAHGINTILRLAMYGSFYEKRPPSLAAFRGE
jgi:hypothetical protein